MNQVSKNVSLKPKLKSYGELSFPGDIQSKVVLWEINRIFYAHQFSFFINRDINRDLKNETQ